MHKCRLFLASTLPLIFPGTAYAHDFSGPRVEARIGYDHLTPSAGPIRRDGDGLLVGGAVGYDVDLGHVVMGLDADISLSTADPATASGSFNARRELSAGVRIGYKVDSGTLLYLTGGYANGRFRVRNSSVGDYSFNDDGFRVGGGLEQRLSDKAFAKLEYRYVNYRTGFGEPDRHQAFAGIGLRF